MFVEEFLCLKGLIGHKNQGVNFMFIYDLLFIHDLKIFESVLRVKKVKGDPGR